MVYERELIHLLNAKTRLRQYSELFVRSLFVNSFVYIVWDELVQASAGNNKMKASAAGPP